jgi:CheY-like chemotaxis protein
MAKILILEPDKRFANSLSDAIQQAGWGTVVISNGQVALESIQESPPSLVILSLQIDNNRGVELCHAIREVPGGELVPILLIGTGEEGVKNFGDALVEGGDYYFQKPVVVDKLISKIRTYVALDKVMQSKPGSPKKTPAKAAAPATDKDLAGRVEQMMGLGQAFKEGILAPPSDEDAAAPESKEFPEKLEQIDQPKSDAIKEAKEKARKEAEEKARKEAEEKARKEAEEKARKEAEEKARKEAEEKARKEAEEKARKEAEEKAKKEAEEKAKKEAEEKAKKEAEEKAKKEAEEKAKKEAEEKAKKAAEEKAKKEAEEKARKEAEEKAKKEAEEKARKEAEEKIRREAEEKARIEAEEKARIEAEEKIRREAEEKARREALERAKKEAEEKIRREAEEKARIEAEEKIRREAEEKARKEVLERAKKEVEEKIRREAEEKARIEAEEKARIEAEEKIRRETEERVRREIEEQRLQEEAEEEEPPPQKKGRLKAEDLWDDDQAESEQEEFDQPKTAQHEGGQELAELLAREAEMAHQEAMVSSDTGSKLPPLPADEAERRQPKLSVLPQIPPEAKEKVRRPKPKRRKEDFQSEYDDYSDQEVEPAKETFFKEAPKPKFKSPDPDKTDLARESAPAILWRLHASEVTGIVTFESNQDTKNIYFEVGIPVGVKSSQTADRLEERLFRTGLIDREAYAEARIKGLEQTRALAAHLVERGFLKPKELFPVVRRHMEDCILGIFEWTHGTVSFQEGYIADDEKIRLARSIPSLLLEGIRRKYLLERMVREIGSPTSLLAPVPIEDLLEKAPPVHTVGFTQEELEVLNLVNGLRPIEEIIFLSGQEVTTVYRVLLTGVVCGLLAVAVRGVGTATEGEDEALQRTISISRKRVEAKLAQVNQASYFEILGIAEDATPYEIDTAYKQLIKEFHDINFSHAELQDLKEKLKIIRATLEEARDILSDELLREGYRQSLTSKA